MKKLGPSGPRVVTHEKTKAAVLACVSWRLAGPHPDHGRVAASFLINDVFALLAESGVTVEEVPDGFSDVLGDIAALRARDLLPARIAKEALRALWAAPGTELADWLVASRALEEAGADALIAAVRVAIDGNPEVCVQIRSGKASAVGFLVGKVMKAMDRKADPTRIRELLDAEFGIPPAT